MATIKCYYYYSDKMHKCKYEKKLNSRFVFHRKKNTACRIWQNIHLDEVILSPVVSYSVALIIISVHRKLYCLRSHWNLIKLSQNCITYITPSLSLSCMCTGRLLYITCTLNWLVCFYFYSPSKSIHCIICAACKEQRKDRVSRGQIIRNHVLCCWRAQCNCENLL